MRGGTSKGIFFSDDDVPVEETARDRVILDVFGSPDVRQIDGLGGADPLTSKTAIVAPATRRGADVDYAFGYVGITSPRIDWRGDCGNISAAVGPYAIDERMVVATDPITTVRIYSRNTGKVLIAEVPTRGGIFQPEGDYAIDGSPGTGAMIRIDFRETAGSLTGKLLPTGNTTDTIVLDDRRSFTVSIVDCANPFVFVRAADAGMTGCESIEEWERHPTALATMEKVRCAAAVKLGLVTATPGVPKVALVAPPRAFLSLSRRLVQGDSVDFLVRMTALQRPHRALGGTAGICAAVASRIPGTVVHEMVPPAAQERDTAVIGHPSGTMPVEVQVTAIGDRLTVRRAAIGRTARRLMEGFAYVGGAEPRRARMAS